MSTIYIPLDESNALKEQSYECSGRPTSKSNPPGIIYLHDCSRRQRLVAVLVEYLALYPSKGADKHLSLIQVAKVPCLVVPLAEKIARPSRKDLNWQMAQSVYALLSIHPDGRVYS